MLGSRSNAQKDSDLVLNFSEILWPSGWALGQVTWAKLAPKLFHLWRHSQKICNPQSKNFFQVQTRRRADPFEPLNSSRAIGRGSMALVRQLKTAGFRLKCRYEYIIRWLSKC